MPETTTITIDGEWYMNQASQRLEQLEEILAELLRQEPRPTRALIDWSGVTGIDACGCQLLAVFRENLKRQGIAPLGCEIAEEIRTRICELGYAESLASAEALAEVPL